MDIDTLAGLLDVSGTERLLTPTDWTGDSPRGAMPRGWARRSELAVDARLTSTVDNPTCESEARVRKIEGGDTSTVSVEKLF